MHAWEAIQHSVDYIEENIQTEMTIDELAKVSYLSVFYFQKLFSRLVGKTVKEYIKARRVANAKSELKTSNKRIADIAMDFGFNSHEVFTKNFKEIYGITPENYRKNEVVLTDFLKPELSIDYTLVDEGVPLLVNDLVLEIYQQKIEVPEYYTGVSKQIDASEMNKVGVNTLVELWDQFQQERATIENLLPEGLVLDYFTMDALPGKVQYFVGGQSTKEGFKHFTQCIIEPGNYYVCSYEAEDFDYLVSDGLYKANTYFFETWLPKHGIGMEDMAPFLIQKYLNVTDDPKIEIWIRPVNQLVTTHE